MFLFYKYAALIFPSLERETYIKDPHVESDGWLSPACRYCRGVFEFLYRDKAECVRPAQSVCHCVICVRQPPTLKAAASDVAFRCVLNLKAFRMNSIVPFHRFKELAKCGLVPGERLFPYTLPCIIIICYCKDGEEEEVALRFHPKCLYTDPNPPIKCDWYEEVVGDRAGFIARLSEEKKHIGVQNVILYCSRLRLRLL